MFYTAPVGHTGAPTCFGWDDRCMECRTFVSNVHRHAPLLRPASNLPSLVLLPRHPGNMIAVGITVASRPRTDPYVKKYLVSLLWPHSCRYRHQRPSRGQSNWLSFHCRTLSFPTPSRSIQALSVSPVVQTASYNLINSPSKIGFD